MRSGTGRSSRPVNRRRSGIRFSEVVLLGRLRKAIRQLNPAIRPRHSVRSRSCATAKIFEEGLLPRDGKLLK